jgi:hypothetical protein
MAVLHTVIETATFIADVRAQGLSDAERQDVVLAVSMHPTAGSLMAHTGGARKRRIAGRGKGKSGGYRVVTYYGGEDVPVFLLLLFSKGERDNLSQADCHELRAILSTLADDYRATVRARLRQMRRIRR